MLAETFTVLFLAKVLADIFTAASVSRLSGSRRNCLRHAEVCLFSFDFQGGPPYCLLFFFFFLGKLIFCESSQR